MTTVRRPGVRLFATPRGEPRSRRATDFVSLGLALVTVALLGVVAEPPSNFERAVLDVAQATPNFLDVVWQSSSDLLAVWAIALVVAALVRRRFDVARDATLASVAGLGYATVLFRLVEGSWPQVLRALASASPPNQLPSLRLALCASIVMTASPHLSRPFRRSGRWIEGLAAASLVALGATSPTGAIMGLFLAVAAAATIHVIVGSSAGRPGLDEVAGALEELGVRAQDLHVPERQVAGMFTVVAVDDRGRSLNTKVYGRDARDTQLLAKFWRTLWYRTPDTFTLTRLQQVEHEAFLTLLAQNAGVPVPTIVAAGRTARNDALLVLLYDSTPLVASIPGSIGDDVVTSVWDAVHRLHQADIAHGNLGPTTIVRNSEGRVLITDLGGATLAPTDDQLQADRAQVLATTALLVGPERALTLAGSALGTDDTVVMLPYLQSAAFGRELRHAAHVSNLDIDELRDQAAAAVGTQPPEMAKLRRVTWRTMVMAAVLTLAAYAIISSLVGVDFNELWQELQGAAWGWVLLGLLVAQTPRFAQAIGTRGASPVPLPYGPVTALEFAICFINLAVPTAAGRIAVEIRFFQRQGLPPASAMSVGAIDSFGGFLVQLMLLATLVVFGVGSVQLNLDLNTSGAAGTILNAIIIAVVVVVVMAITFLVIPRLRRWLWARVHPWITQILDTLRGVRSPARFLQILGGNLLADILFALALALFLKAFGVSVGLGTLLVINVATSLFVGLMPVPGGIGVAEATLVSLLVAAGVDQTVAFAAATLNRAATFYLPPIWGGFSFHWLERHRYL